MCNWYPDIVQWVVLQNMLHWKERGWGGGPMLCNVQSEVARVQTPVCGYWGKVCYQWSLHSLCSVSPILQLAKHSRLDICLQFSPFFLLNYSVATQRQPGMYSWRRAGCKHWGHPPQMSCCITYASLISQARIDACLILSSATERLVVFQMDFEVLFSSRNI